MFRFTCFFLLLAVLASAGNDFHTHKGPSTYFSNAILLGGAFFMGATTGLVAVRWGRADRMSEQKKVLLGQQYPGFDGLSQVWDSVSILNIVWEAQVKLQIRMWLLSLFFARVFCSDVNVTFINGQRNKSRNHQKNWEKTQIQKNKRKLPALTIAVTSSFFFFF